MAQPGRRSDVRHFARRGDYRYFSNFGSQRIVCWRHAILSATHCAHVPVRLCRNSKRLLTAMLGLICWSCGFYRFFRFYRQFGGRLVGVRFPIFLLTTFFGIMPGTFVFASIGNGISVLLQSGERPDLSIMQSPEILGPLVALAVLSLAPIIWRRMKGTENG